MRPGPSTFRTFVAIAEMARFFVEHDLLLGRTVSGPLAGRRLDPVAHGDDCWFEWSAFRPATRVYR
jgi:hypothetical protein